MVSISELDDAQQKMNELLRQLDGNVGSDKVIFPIVLFLLENAGVVNFATLNQGLDALIRERNLDEDFAITIQGWYRTLNNVQKSTLLRLVSSTPTAH